MHAWVPYLPAAPSRWHWLNHIHSGGHKMVCLRHKKLGPNMPPCAGAISSENLKLSIGWWMRFCL